MVVDFQQQSTQRLVDKYEHMNNRNDRLDLRLNPLQRNIISLSMKKVM